MGWFRRRRATTPAPDRNEHTESVDVGGDRLVFWKAKSEEVEGEIYGPVWIADANARTSHSTSTTRGLPGSKPRSSPGSAASRSRTCEPRLPVRATGRARRSATLDLKEESLLVKAGLFPALDT